MERALRSRTFARSEQLRAFLRFVCETEITGKGGLTEYVIGVEVLGRPEGYSPAEDSSVRTRAYELRQKIEKLYAQELREEPVQILIPKGTYAPLFVKTGPTANDTSLPSLADVPAAAPAPVLSPVFGTRTFLAGCLIGAVLAAAFALAVTKLRPARNEVDPILREAWRPLSMPNANVLLCAATPLHLVVGPEGHGAYGSPAYPAPPEAYLLFRQHRPLAPDAKLGLLFTDNVLGVGTMNAVVSTVNTLRSLGTSYQILPERVATLSALRGRNAVLFGAPVDSEAITRTMHATPLTVAYAPSVKEFVVLDRESGRMLVPKRDVNGDFVDVYGLATVLQTGESERGRTGMIVFSGITSAGTQGAAEFFASPSSLRSLRDVFQREGIGGFPPAYQVVVRCKFSNALLLSYQYESHKVLPKE
jgi:hypothetical protein